MAKGSKALHLNARGVTTVPGSNPGCITSGRDCESHRAGGAQLAQRRPGLAIIVYKNLFYTDLPIYKYICFYQHPIHAFQVAALLVLAVGMAIGPSIVNQICLLLTGPG